MSVILQMDGGYESAVVGVVERCNKEPFLLYDREKVIEILMERDGMTWEEAVEFFHFNQLGAWVGEGTPGFLMVKENWEEYCAEYNWDQMGPEHGFDEEDEPFVAGEIKTGPGGVQSGGTG